MKDCKYVLSVVFLVFFGKIDDVEVMVKFVIEGI